MPDNLAEPAANTLRIRILLEIFKALARKPVLNSPDDDSVLMTNIFKTLTGSDPAAAIRAEMTEEDFIQAIYDGINGNGSDKSIYLKSLVSIDGKQLYSKLKGDDSVKQPLLADNAESSKVLFQAGGRGRGMRNRDTIASIGGGGGDDFSEMMSGGRNRQNSSRGGASASSSRRRQQQTKNMISTGNKNNKSGGAPAKLKNNRINGSGSGQQTATTSPRKMQRNAASPTSVARKNMNRK
jgi:hypothetical protein